MNYSRRGFIKAGGFAAVATFGLASLGFGQKGHSLDADLPNEIYSDPMYYQNAESFKNHVGSEFSIMGRNEVTTAVLVEVKESSTNNKSAAMAKLRKYTPESFSLAFQINSSAMQQKTYPVCHPNFVQFDLFMVPGKKANGAHLLHAVFNRI
jgi:hypothetical protein